jgi:N-acetylglucosaminyldiphosphoundecaprenol N-acetyl-beta-D-mannosaminyltransferase
VSATAHPAGRPVVCGCALDALTLDEAVATIDERIAGGERYEHVSINAAKLVRLQHDELLRDAVRRCELATADGQAVVWAARLLGHRLPERVAGIDLMQALLGLAEQRHYRVFVLGARPEALEEAVRRMRERFPGLRLVGWHHGYYAPAEEPRIVGRIRASSPDILFIAMETPAKEIFVAQHRERLGVRFVMGVGGSIDVLAGARRRAPRWMQRGGLEWLFRLLQDPRRLARRYVVGNTKFTLMVLREALRRPSAATRSAP